MTERHSLHPIPRLTLARLGVAVSSSLLAAVLTDAAMPFLEQNVFLLFLIAILASSLYGGMWTGLVASALSVLGVSAYVFEPIGSLRIASGVDVARVLVFALFAGVISVLAQALIATRRRLEQRADQARAGEESFRELFNSTADAIYVIGPTGRLLNVNDAATELHGRSREAMLGLSWETVAQPKNDLAAARASIERAFSGEPQSLEASAAHASGRAIPIEVKLTAARYFNRDVLIAVARDLSERRRLEEQLRHSQKMEAVGRLAGGVAHDFNNLLTSIRGYASLMRDRVAHDRSLTEDLTEIERAVDLATSVTSQLLAFSRKQEYLPRPVSLNDSLSLMEGLLRRVIGERVELVVEKDPELGRAMLDEGQIEQVIMNLVVNARDALRDGGRITIRTRNIEAVSPPGPHVVLTVGDDGVGMDEATRARLFEPFFTTKSSGHGTGLGLSTVYGIVNQSGGHVEVESVPGGGSTFAVVFPRVDAPAASPERRGRPRPAGGATGHQPALPGAAARRGAATPERGAASPAGGAASPAGGAAAQASGRTILLAEDEAPVRNLVRRILSRRGYRVIEAENGREALEALRAHDGTIDALVTDVVMPELTGPELAERVRAEHPALPVLFTSGYNEEGMEGTGIVSGLSIAFLQKPFMPEELLRLLGELLERPE